MKAYVFPGQGAQFSGMGKDLYDQSVTAREMFAKANEILGFDIQRIMFEGTDEELKETKVTQPAMVAGHSLGEFSALVANKTLTFEDGLRLVSKRALAMQKACEKEPSTMAAILGLEDADVENICSTIQGVVVPANYNCPGQLVISGAFPAVEAACAALTDAGAKRAMILQVGGAFHSPLMEPAREELAAAIEETKFSIPICAVYQNVNAQSITDPKTIKENLVAQLTGPVKWTQIMQNMLTDGCKEVVEVGPGKVLQGLFKKVDREIPTSSATI